MKQSNKILKLVPHFLNINFENIKPILKHYVCSYDINVSIAVFKKRELN